MENVLVPITTVAINLQANEWDIVRTMGQIPQTFKHMIGIVKKTLEQHEDFPYLVQHPDHHSIVFQIAGTDEVFSLPYNVDQEDDAVIDALVAWAKEHDESTTRSPS